MLSLSINMSARATAWSVTMNMKTIPREKCENYIDNARFHGWSVEGQIEKGQEGTQHYQLLVKTPQVRFSAVKKLFPTAHIEVARNVSALQNYVHKDDTRVEELKKVSVAITWPNVCDKFFDWVIQHDVEEVWKERDYERRMNLWDEFIDESIGEGIRCELIGVNPQYRSSVQRYWNGMCRQAFLRRQDRQDRQNINSQTDGQTEQNVVVPMYINQDGGDSSVEASCYGSEESSVGSS